MIVLRLVRYAVALLLASLPFVSNAQGKPGEQFSWPSHQFSTERASNLFAQANEALAVFKANKHRLGLPESIDRLSIVWADDLDSPCLSPSNFAYLNIARAEVRLCKKSLVNFIEYQHLTIFVSSIDPKYVDNATLIENYSVGLIGFFETQQNGRRMRSGPCPAAYMAMLLNKKLDPSECFIGNIPHHAEWSDLSKAGLPYIDPEANILQAIAKVSQQNENFDERAETALFESFKGKSSKEKIEQLFWNNYPDMIRGAIGHIMAHEIGHFAVRDEPKDGCAGYKAEQAAEAFAYAVMKKADAFSDIPYSTNGTIFIKNYDAVFVMRALGDLDEETLNGLDVSQIEKLPRALRGPSLGRVAAFLRTLRENPGWLSAIGVVTGDDDTEQNVSELLRAIDQLPLCR